MKEAFKRVFPVILIHLAVGFLCTLVVSLKESAGVELLPPLEFAFKVRRAGLSFARLFPALVASGLLIGYALAFRKIIVKNAGQGRARFFPVFRNAFVFSIIFAGVYAFLLEGVVPALIRRQNEARAKTDAYNNYMFLGRIESDAGNFRAALSNAEAALEIWNDSPEARQAVDTARIQVAELYGGAFAFAERDSASGDSLSFPQGGLTAFELLERAREAASRADFYNAHYYAALSWRAADAGDPNRDAAIRLASESWNRVTKALDEIQAEPERLYYERKLKGYSYIRAGDFLSAYYYFLQMREEDEGMGRSDPDIAAFLEIARQGVLASFFFIDETENLALFEQNGGIFFTLPNDAGGKDAILIGGVFRKSAGAEDGAYFRELEIARFDSGNRLVFHVSAPYAKMSPFIDNDGISRPQLILTAVDRAEDGLRKEPQVIAGSFPPQDSPAPSVLLLEMPYQDMILLINSSLDAHLMTTHELLGFIRLAETYGLQKAVYLAEFLQRIAETFLVFIMFVIALVWAWKFQLRESRPFSAWWVVFVPLVAIACWYIIAVVRYAASLYIMLLAAKAPSLAVPCLAALIVAMAFAASAWFFSQRGEHL